MVTEVICPICKSHTPFEGNPLRPFCSKRCKMIDLGAWANEDYRVESKEEKPSTTEPGQPLEPLDES